LLNLELLENVGRYTIVGELGAGSMSRVYLADDPNLDRKVALKVVLQGFSLDNREQGELERRFLLEARAAGKLSHPGIVRVYDASTDPETGTPYIAMEWVKGRSLRSLLEDKGRLSGPKILDILAQVARALDYAHRAGRIHRDIKPSNILITTDGIAKVSDFGVAKIVSESHTISGQVLGTPAYMSPEQVRDDPLDGRSDLFSLGAVLYQCVSGTTPFGGDSLVQVVYKILNVDPRPLKLPSSPAWTLLAKVADRGLQRDPNARFQTGSEFADALEEVATALGSEPISDFRGAGSATKPKGPSDTIKIQSPVTDRPTGTVQRQTQTVQLSNTEIQDAMGGNTDPDQEDSREPVFDPISSERAGALGTRTRKLTAASAIVLLAATIAVIAIFNLSRQPIEAPEATQTQSPVSGSATPVDTPFVPEKQQEEPKAQEVVAETPAEEPAEKLVPPAVASHPAVTPRSTTTTQPVGTLTPVTILYRHKGGLAYLTILLDGVRVWNQELKPVEGRLQKLSGYDSRAIVPVPSGVHTLKVQLSDPDREVRTSKSIRSRYTNGKKRTLRVYIDSDDNEMQLRWKE